MGNIYDTRSTTGTSNSTSNTCATPKQRQRVWSRAQDLLQEKAAGRPVWVRAPKNGLCPWTGLSRSGLYGYAAGGFIRTASIRQPGQVKGTRLFHVESILQFIERHATGPAVETTTSQEVAK